MTGKPNHNRDAFNEAEAELARNGWEVVNPARNFGGRTDLPREEYFLQDIPQLVTCDAILLLDGWKESRGARLEFAIARECGIRALTIIEQGPAIALSGDDLFDSSVSVDIEPGTYPPGVGAIDTWPRQERENRARIAAVYGDSLAASVFSEPPSGEPESDINPETESVPKPLPFHTLLDTLKALHDAKRADYTGGGHPLANYAAAANSIGITTEQSMLLRMHEKMFRISSLLKSNAAPRNESITDSYMDIANIALLCILNRDPESGYNTDGLRDAA